MNFLAILLPTTLCFVTPPILDFTGAYWRGDPDIIAVSDSNQRMKEYRVPQDSIGGQIKFKMSDGSPVNIYVNRNEDSFNKAMNPPVNEFTEERLSLIALNDEKFVLLFHDKLMNLMGKTDDWSIVKTVKLINSLDDVIHTRLKSPRGQKISRKEMREMKNRIEEMRDQGLLDELKTSSSFSSRMTQSQAQSETSDED